MPSGLKELIVSGNRLTSLPVLPSELKELMVSGNRLTSLPMLPSGLLSLSVYRNQLTRLPESLIHLSSETTVNLEGNPLSERTLQALREITSAPGYSGPIIRFDMAGASAPR
ncbi:E3 ubiquitin-protein ligase SspH2, partial [Salmonella enterica subsp. enterica serovar Heidelberg str. 670102-3]